MFTDIQLNERLQKALDAQGIHTPTEVQQATLEPALQGKDLMISAVTGSGKTYAFLLPLLQRFIDTPAPRSATRALILVPTRELAEQVSKSCDQLAAFTQIKSMSVFGGVGFKEQAARLRKNPEILVATPGRLLEHLESGSVDLSDLEALVLDEADRMLDMGFSEDVLKIATACRSERQTLLFSATLNTREIGHLIQQVMRDPEALLLSDARTRVTAITQQIVLADDAKHKERLLNQLLTETPFQRALIFTNTRVAADQLGHLLRYHKHRTAVLHGDMDQPQRRLVLQRFRDNAIQILVATDVAARGLDIEGVDLVINYMMARSGDDYVHRIGRTGRAGQLGTAISLISATEWNLMCSIERYLKVKFERRTLAGLEGSFNGPTRTKSSGKAVGKKKRTDSKKPEAKPKVKKRLRDQKTIGKRRQPNIPPSGEQPVDQGFAPLKKKST
ncbi:MAG: DEAD/DEAH box helicase [Nitrincola lacisaponensis]|uniref:DEAD/DEAH box helicase n=1 Tax=Nitrincola lacisaponensis TaxID=267850 RepID=UPI00391A2365